jgi:hypothetical protein
MKKSSLAKRAKYAKKSIVQTKKLEFIDSKDLILLLLFVTLAGFARKRSFALL